MNGRSRSGSVDSLGRHKRKRESKHSGGSRRASSRSFSRSRSRSFSRSASRSPSRRGSSSSRHGGRERGRDRDRRRSRDRRSRSRSRSRSRDRERGGRSREYQRSDRATGSRRSRSRSLSRSRRDSDGRLRNDGAAVTHDKNADKQQSNHADAKEPEVASETANLLAHLTEEEQMQALMGFGGFDSTKGKVVEDNAKGASTGGVRKESKRAYRQYMNRRGGFNRPLDQK